MKTQIRKAVFETNSSSSHSLTLSEGDVQMLTFPPEVLKAGKVEIGCDEFGWEWARLYQPISKLTYLVTGATHGDIASFESPEQVTEFWRETNVKVDQLCRVVEEHTGCRLLLIPGTTGYIDHESVGADHEAYADDETLRRFIFGPDAFVETGNDNSGPPSFIQTDRGPREDYYGYFKVEPPTARGLVLAKLFIADFSLVNANGADLGSSTLMGAIQKHAVVVNAVMTVNQDYDFYSSDETSSVLAELVDNGLHPSTTLTVKLARDKSKPSYSRSMEFDILLPKKLATALGELV
jgi:hypothetical protein